MSPKLLYTCIGRTDAEGVFMGLKKVEAAATGDVDRHHGLHTQACFDYARQTMKDVGIAHCISQCSDERSARLAAGASKVPSRAAAGINKERERALDTLTGFGVPDAHALEVLNIFEGAIVNELASFETTECPFCDDSTHGHECPGPRACPDCDQTGFVRAPCSDSPIAAARKALTNEPCKLACVDCQTYCDCARDP